MLASLLKKILFLAELYTCMNYSPSNFLLPLRPLTCIYLCCRYGTRLSEFLLLEYASGLMAHSR